MGRVDHAVQEVRPGAAVQDQALVLAGVKGRGRQAETADPAVLLDVLRALAQALPGVRALKELDLWNNSVSDEANEALRSAWGAREGNLGI